MHLSSIQCKLKKKKSSTNPRVTNDSEFLYISFKTSGYTAGNLIARGEMITDHQVQFYLHDNILG